MSYALITGSSKGIGKAIAESLAKRKYNLLLVARSDELLEKVAKEIMEKYHVDVKWLALDLSGQDSAIQVNDWIVQNDFPLSILVNNAGYGLWGKFHELSLEDQTNMLQLNVWTLIKLTYLLIPVLQKGHKAYILNTGSMAGLQSMPTLNLYAASKAMVNTFTRALHHELKDTNISVSLLVPGSVDTNFIERSGMHHMQKMSDKMSMTANKVATIAVKGMLSGKKEIVPGFSNRVGALLVKVLPKSLIENIAGSLYKNKG